MPRLDDEPLLPLTQFLGDADRHWLSIGCRTLGCQRTVKMGFRRAVRLAAGMRTEDWLARLRCTACGNRNATLTVCADSRNPDAIARDGFLLVTRQE
ncbi:hypothetical protein [Sabulicella glaciei]|uniref:Uncharacterized protein n=1 Tax=Sabulicella glaciei TaxID=2984948 RepID=A0ABT3NQS7_9PROT|nr:hypothetical protein [Roseococcus sp. MDT2-1-1]MCW8084514.1 hypothetical protein [Roseococcus sp. MDT2-1-1]